MEILGIDIGGTAIKAAPVDTVTGRLVAERLRLATPQPSTPDSIARTIQDICRHFRWHGPVGCGFPAVIRHGQVLTAANIDVGWLGVNLREMLTGYVESAVTVINDADAAGLAEMRFGAGRGETGTVVMVTAGTGIGTALFRDGVLFPNTEFGHLPLGDLSAEQFAAASVIAREGVALGEWAKRFGTYLNMLEELLWPDLFILGGEISTRHAEFLPDLVIRTRIVPAALGNDAGLIGAALHTVPTAT